MSIMYKEINNLNQLPNDYTFEDISCQYSTGRSIYLRGTGRNKEYEYRNGVMTKLGDIEQEVWKEAVKYLIDKTGELEVYCALKAWTRDNCAWLHNEKQLEEYTLEIHSSRTFENKEWKSYKDFYQNYLGRNNNE